MLIYRCKNTSFFLITVVLLAVSGQTYAQSQALSNLVERAGQSGVQQLQIQELQQRAQANGLSDEQIIAILEPAVSLSEQNLPTDHLLQKAFEGLSKRVPPQSVALLLGNMMEATRQASGFVATWVETPGVQQALQRESRSPQSFRDEMIKGAAQGIQQGIPTETLELILDGVEARGILQRTGTSSIVSAIRILPDLSVNGDAGQSTALLLRALEGGFGTEEIQKLPAAMNVARQRSQLPASGVIESVSNQLNSGVPAAEVLQNLLDGDVGGGPPGGTPPGLENNPGRGNPNPGQGNPNQNPGNGNGPGNSGGNGNPGGGGNPNPGGGNPNQNPGNGNGPGNSGGSGNPNPGGGGNGDGPPR